MSLYRAPGKLVLIGEYAVLDGAPALVMAVDRGVACRVHPGRSLQITTPAGTDDRFVGPALEGAPPGRYVFSAWNPTATSSKAGLGGSAAATVVAVLAASTEAGSPLSPQALHRRAAAIHHQVQGGGSGVDVAAAALGGVLRFQGGQATPASPVCPTVVFTGRSAATGPRVAKYLSLPDRAAFVAASEALVEGFYRAPALALREAGARLRQLADRAGIHYWTPEIDELVRLARHHQGGAKPSGAGGGDVVIALFPNPELTEIYTREVTRRGYVVIPTQLAPGAHRV